MKKNLVLLGACAALVSASASHAAVIDDFSDGSLSEYTLTRVLDNGVAESNVSFSSSTGSLVSTYTTSSATNQAEQVVLLRSDISLTVGQTLLVDVSIPTTTSAMDFGIAVSATATPTGAVTGATDTRASFSWAAVYVRPSQDSVRSTFANSTTAVTSVGVLSAVETSVSQLYITRITATQFDLGYYDTTGTKFSSQTVTFTSTSVGTAIGFYGDLRTSGASIGSLDNLSIVPEPSAALLGGLGALSLLRRRRR